MTASPSLRERAVEGARHALCTFRFTDGFCTGGDPDCPSCGRLGEAVARGLLGHVRPTLQRILREKGVPEAAVILVLQALDEAVA